MEISIRGTGVGGTVRAIPSKSLAHRMLICASLAEGESEVVCPTVNADIEATAVCLRALGASLRRVGESIFVRPLARERAETCAAPCGESGSTLRFLLPVACALGRNATFTGRGRLPERPMDALCAALRAHGADVSADKLPITVSGALRGGEFRLPHNVSSQYVSGLLFALALLEEGGAVALDGEPESAPYIELTRASLSRFGVRTAREGNAFLVPPGQKYVSSGRVVVEGDWSNAAFWLCAGAIGRKTVTVTGLDAASLQGDRAVTALLERFGARVETAADAVTVSPGALRGIEIDARDIPDLVPVLAVTAAAAEGETRVTGAKRLRLKESDRIASTSALLRALGAQVRETEDGLVITGGGLRGGTVDSCGDHRIAMAAATASCACAQPVTIRGAEAVAKSYPDFFADFAALGGEITDRRE